MKNLILLLFLCGSCLATSAIAQTKPKDAGQLTQLLGFEDVKIGSSTVLRIPAIAELRHVEPNGPGSQRIKLGIAGTLEILSIYLSADDRKKTEADPQAVWNYYAMLSTVVRDEKSGVSPLEWEQFAAGNSKELDLIFDVGGRVMASALQDLHSKIVQIQNNAPPTGLGELKKLGIFSKNGTMVSLLLTQTGAVNGQRVTYLMTGSSIYLKNRILFLHIFRQYRSDIDFDMLGRLTKKWTAAIIAANK